MKNNHNTSDIPLRVIVAVLALIPSLYFLDAFNDSILIRSNWEYSLKEFGFFSVTKLWLVSVFGLLVYAFISCILLTLINIVGMLGLNSSQLAQSASIDDEALFEVMDYFPGFFFISLFLSAVFLFIDIPREYNSDAKLHQMFLPQTSNILYKNEHLADHVVMNIQRQLVFSGHNVSVDGIYGDVTQSKVLKELEKKDIEISSDKLNYAGMYLLNSYSEDKLRESWPFKEGLIVLLKIFLYTFGASVILRMLIANA